MQIDPGWKDILLGTRTGKNFVFYNEGDIKLIVKIIGSHMEDLSYVIKNVADYPNEPVKSNILFLLLINFYKLKSIY